MYVTKAVCKISKRTCNRNQPGLISKNAETGYNWLVLMTLVAQEKKKLLQYNVSRQKKIKLTALLWILQYSSKARLGFMDLQTSAFLNLYTVSQSKTRWLFKVSHSSRSQLWIIWGCTKHYYNSLKEKIKWKMIAQ